jgi:hypothetical protein
MDLRPVHPAPPIVHEALRSPGQPLDLDTRAFMEPRIGHDFSRMQIRPPESRSAPAGLTIGAPHDRSEKNAEAMAQSITQMTPAPSDARFDLSDVRVHTDARAASAARSINAYAYTVGRDIVFNEGQYSPHSGSGVRLLAHELTHVAQQGAMAQPSLVQRDGMGDVRIAEAITELTDQIRANAVYKAQSADDVKLTEEVITEIGKRSRADQYHFLSKLKQLFETPVKPPATISTETQATTVTAAKTEKTRLAKPAEAKNTTLEEKTSAGKRPWVPIVGKFGGGTYYVDRSSPTNLVVKAEILLTPKGTGTKADVDAIKSMEDGIEKAASTKGYIVDISFVNTAGADTFQVDVDPSKWEVATNWSGGDPVGFAHELHHMFAFELDRYNYVESHSTNESMEVPDRLYWFRQELSKPANYNDPTSIMDSASHTNDNDACQVAGLDIAKCVPARAAARAAGTL